MNQPPRVLLIALGGTIASVEDSSVEPGTVTPALSAGKIAEAVPGLGEIATIESVDLDPVASFELGPVEMLAVAHRIATARERGVDGTVVVQGTDTLEETAYMLALTLERTHPVVVTGALRNPSLPSPDGPANLLAATRVAADRQAARLGPVAVLNDEIHLARWVTKAHTSRPSAMRSPGTGPVGEVVEGEVHVWHAPLFADHLGLPRELGPLDVPLVRISAGDDGRLLRALCDSVPRGVVIEGTGGGHVPSALLDAVDSLIAADVPVVVATRSATGRNLRRTYGMLGGEIDLCRRGALPAGWLSGAKARLRLITALALGLDPATAFPAD